MNRIEALKAAFEIAGPNVTAEEHIQYAEFLLGDENVVYIKDWITVEDTQSICDDLRDYDPYQFGYLVGEAVYEVNDDIYPVGAVARDDDGDVWVKTEGGWNLYYAETGELSEAFGGIKRAANYGSVFVA